jgi:hypothetical protein
MHPEIETLYFDPSGHHPIQLRYKGLTFLAYFDDATHRQVFDINGELFNSSNLPMGIYDILTQHVQDLQEQHQIEVQNKRNYIIEKLSGLLDPIEE